MHRSCSDVIAARGGHNPMIHSLHVTHFSVNTSSPELGRLQLDNTVTIPYHFIMKYVLFN